MRSIAAYYGTECFKFTENFTRITLPAAILPKHKENEGKGFGKEFGKGFGKALATNQINIIQCIVNNPKITIVELAESIGVSTRTVEKNIKTLREAGVIERVGGRKAGYWHYKGEKDV